MMNIKLTARLGREIGLGHWKRCSYLAQALSQLGHQVYLEPVVDSISKDLHLFSPEGSPKDSYDIEIVDDPLFSPKKENTKNPFRVALDFYGDNHLFHLVINVFKKTDRQIANTVSGIEYMILDPQSKSYIPNNPSENRILLVLGGMDTKNCSLSLVHHLLANQRTFNHLDVILNRSHRDFQKLLSLVEQESCVTIHDFQENILSFIQNSSLLVCNGGGIAALSVVQKRPALFCPQTEHEKSFLGILGASYDQILDLGQISNRSIFLEKLEWVAKNQFIPVSKLDSEGVYRVAHEIVSRYNAGR